MPPIRTPFPYTTLFRSRLAGRVAASGSRIGARALRARVHLTRRRAGQGRLAERQPAEPGTGVRNARAAGVRSRRVRDHRPGTPGDRALRRNRALHAEGGKPPDANRASTLDFPPETER